MNIQQRFRLLAGALALLLLAAGCAGSVRYASTKDGFYSLGSPQLQVTVKPPLQFVGNGKLWASVPSDDSMQQPMGSFAWSVYAEGTEGPLKSTAHIILSDLTNNNWIFEKETWPNPEDLLLSKSTENGQYWTERISYVHSEKDWFSALWQANGRTVPEMWIAKRWSTTTMDDSSRVVVEYREPAPASLVNSLASGVTERSFLWANCAKDLDGFVKRANAAFSMTSSSKEVGIGQPASWPLNQPPFMPDMKKLVGKAQANWGGNNPLLPD